MDTQQLDAFIAVAETCSFSEAAHKIHITQPAVSKRIAQLEDFLGTRLFDRIARAVNLTEAGEALLPRARNILKEIAASKQAINDLSGAVSGQLRLAISHHIGLHRLPPVLKQFSQMYPDVTIDVNFMDSEKAYEGILHGDFEVATITLSPSEHPRITAHAIWPDPLVFMVANTHPLAELSEVSLDKLTNYPAILPGSGTYTGQMTKALFERHGLVITSTMETNYLETIHMMVSIGLGWSLLPKSMLDTDVVEVPVTNIHVERKLGYIYHREKLLSNAAQAFINLLEEHDSAH